MTVTGDRSPTTPISPEKAAIARIHRGNLVVGAGFWVAGGYVLTCAHVVRDALGLAAGALPLGQCVEVSFPYGCLEQRWPAEVLLYEYHKGDTVRDQDVAGLRLLADPPAGLCPVRLLRDYQFRTTYEVLGFPKNYPKGIASYGQLLTELPSGWVQMEDTKAQGLAIQPGFSGTAVWEGEAVVGMVVARDRNQPEAKVGFMVPGRCLLGVVQALACHDLLARLLGSTGEISSTLNQAMTRAFRLCCPPQWPTPPTPKEMLADLQQVQQSDRPFAPLDQFVALLCLPDLNPDPALRATLESWLGGRGPGVPDLLGQAQRLWQQQPPASQTPNYLLIYVENASTEERPVSALWVRDPGEYARSPGMGSERLQAPGQAPFYEKVTLATLPDLVQVCLEEAVRLGAQGLRLHLILPVEWLTQGCDRWPVIVDDGDGSGVLALLGDVRLGERYCCSVGITERLDPKVIQRFQEPWRAKWQQLVAPGDRDLGAALVAADGLEPGPALRASLTPASVLGFTLATVYPEDNYARIFAQAIAAGTPVALWLRSDQFTAEASAPTALRGLLADTLPLPERVKQCRCEALMFAETEHIGHHLSLLWDDPTLMPVKAPLSYPQP